MKSSHFKSHPLLTGKPQKEDWITLLQKEAKDTALNA